MGLRNYQANCLEKIKQGLKQGVTRQLVAWATGTGKTALFANLPDALDLKGRMLVLVHREELATQAEQKIRHWNPGKTVGVEMGDRYSSNLDQIVVASVQTIGRKDSKRIAKFKPEDFDAVVIDECFPAGTLVDGKPIESLQIGDLVTAFDETTGKFSKKRVTRLFKKKASALVRVTAGGKEVICTPNHPFFTKRGWVNAERLTSKDEIYYYGNGFSHTDMHLLQGDSAIPYQRPASSGEERRESGLLNEVSQQVKLHDDVRDEQENFGAVKQTNDSYQSYAQAGYTGEGLGYFKGNELHILGTRGKRNRVNRAGTSFIGSFGMAYQCGGANENAQGQRLPDLLQTGHRQQRSYGRSGSRRQFPPYFEWTSTGQEERGVLGWVGVDSVEILQPGSDRQFNGLCSKSEVFNFEVEDYHTYIANGFLVHNCHHCLADSYLSILNYFKVFDPRSKTLLLGVTATPSRSDGQGLNKVFQTITDDLSILWGIQSGWLVDLKGIRVKSGVLLDGVHSRAGDFAQDELELAVNVSARNDLIVRSWLSKGQDRPTIAFTVDIKHGKDLASAFKSYGVVAEAVWGDDPNRAEKLAAHRVGKIKILCNCALLTEGYDDPNIGCIIMARPTQSEGLYTQLLGRGTRLPEGVDNLIEAKRRGEILSKEDCLVLDVCDVTNGKSLVTINTLFGLSGNTDLNGRSVVKAAEVLKAAQLQHPTADLTKLGNIQDLDKFLETVDLFKVEYPKEIIQISDYQWHRTFDGSYVLMLAKGENVCVYKDVLDNWNIKGTVNGASFNRTAQVFDNAINEADSMVRALGGRSITALAKREAKWHKAPPTQIQMNMCKRLGLKVPEGATKGEVHERINLHLLQLKEKRKVA